MKSWTYMIDQWNFWQRSLLLLFSLFVLCGSWYFLLEKPFLEKNQAVFEQQKHDQALAKELNELVALQANFVYKNELQQVQFKPVFQKAISETTGITMVNYVDHPAVTLPAGARQFAGLATILNLSLLNNIQKSSATFVFSGEFNHFVAYLQALQGNGYPIYFDNIDFDMKRYPKATITMKVFTLEEA